MARNPLGPGEADHAFKVWLADASLGELRCRGWHHDVNEEHPDVAIGRLEDGAIGIIGPCANQCGVTIFERIGGRNPGRQISYTGTEYLIKEEDGFWIGTEERQIIKAEYIARIKRGERLPFLNPDAVLGWRTLFR